MEKLEAELARPSLYDEALRVLARQGLAVPEAALNRDISAAWVHSEAVQAMWEAVYRAPDSALGSL